VGGLLGGKDPTGRLLFDHRYQRAGFRILTIHAHPFRTERA